MIFFFNYCQFFKFLRTLFNMKENKRYKPKKGKKNFTAEDDKKLMSLANQYQNNWETISQIMNRNKRTCKERYEQYLLYEHSTWHWTLEEKIQLIYLQVHYTRH